MLGPSDSAITLSQRNLLQKLCMLIIKKILFHIVINPTISVLIISLLFAFLMTDTIYEAIIIKN